MFAMTHPSYLSWRAFSFRPLSLLELDRQHVYQAEGCADRFLGSNRLDVLFDEEIEHEVDPIDQRLPYDVEEPPRWGTEEQQHGAGLSQRTPEGVDLRPKWLPVPRSSYLESEPAVPEDLLDRLGLNNISPVGLGILPPHDLDHHRRLGSHPDSHPLVSVHPFLHCQRLFEADIYSPVGVGNALPYVSSPKLVERYPGLMGRDLQGRQDSGVLKRTVHRKRPLPKVLGCLQVLQNLPNHPRFSPPFRVTVDFNGVDTV